MRIYIIRHGDPIYETDTITPAGHLEAQAVACRMASHGLDRIYTSPLGRALATARYTADALEIEPRIEEWTRELSGWTVEPEPWGALPAWDLPGEVIRSGESLPTHDTWHTFPFFDRPEFRATLDEMKRNSDTFLSRHGYERVAGRYRCVQPNSEQIAVFCHGGFGLFWIAHLLEIPFPLVWSGFWLAPTSVTTILFDERSKDWAVPRCLGLGDVSHLYAEGLPVRPRGIRANFL